MSLFRRTFLKLIGGRFSVKCNYCNRLLPLANIANPKAIRENPDIVCCVGCRKQCSSCQQYIISKSAFIMADTLCNRCFITRKAALGNVLFRYPQLNFRQSPFPDTKLREELEKERVEGEKRRTTRGGLSDAELRRRYYHRHKHRPQ